MKFNIVAMSLTRMIKDHLCGWRHLYATIQTKGYPQYSKEMVL